MPSQNDEPGSDSGPSFSLGSSNENPYSRNLPISTPLEGTGIGGGAGGGGNPPPNPSKKRWNPLVVVFLLSGLFFTLFVAISAYLFFGKTESEESWGEPKSAIFSGSRDAVAVVEVSGVIFDSKKVLRHLKNFEDERNVKALVLRVNSPGGSVAPSQEIYEAVKRYPKPVVASMGSVAASGGLYVSCGAKKVFANPGTITGSIGVIMQFANLEKLYQWAKIERYEVKTGKFKGAGSDVRRLTAEEEAVYQGMIDDVLEQFKAAVIEGRKLSKREVARIADGRVMTGAQAKKLKLVDELGTIQDAIDEAAKLGGIQGKPRIIYPRRKKARLIDFVLDNGRSEDEAKSFLRDLKSLFFGRDWAESEVSPLNPPLGLYWLWNGAR